ncbi:MAG: EamA/RhaT family transporter [Ilumatobacteraceae bacterium]|nr:EamA/RhaT family transporter [Ilumatobacteraceae bacterium]
MVGHTTHPAERFAPGIFVVLWSTGFIVARYGTRDAGPLTFLTLRMFFAAAALMLFAQFTKTIRLSRQHIGVAAIVGVLMHALYLGGVFVAADHGLPSGLIALIAGLHPVITAVASRLILAEALSKMQRRGIALGVVGVCVVVIEKMQSSSSVKISGVGLIAMALAITGMAAGTLVQRAKGTNIPLLAGTAVQYVSAGVVLCIGAICNEHWQFTSTARSWLSLAWAVGVLSIVAVLLMLYMLNRQAAAKVSSLFFLTPALSAIESAILFGERLGALAIIGLLVALVGVRMTTRAA